MLAKENKNLILNDFEDQFSAKILIVDDQQSNIDSLVDALEPLNLTFATTTSPYKAFELMIENRGDFAAILLDVQMPEMDGFELARRIHQLDIEHKPPIIFLTAVYKDQEHIYKGYQSGAIDYLAKPINIHVLRSKITVFKEMYHQNQKNIQLSHELSKSVKELKDINENLNSFAYVVSHDLKAPLRQIYGFIDAFSEIFQETLESNEEGVLYLKKIQDCAKRMNRIVDDILCFAKYGLTAINPEHTKLSNLVHIAKTRLSHMIKEHGARLIFNQDEVINVDKDKFTLVLQNLIQNSIKYRRKNTVPCITISSEAKQENILIKIKDNGLGIDSKHHNDVFGFLKRLHTEDEIPGTGIGLSICKKIVEAHEGRIWLESNKGDGSVFFIELPCRRMK